LKKIQNDDHDNMVKHLSKLEVDNLNLQLKYQHLEEKMNISKAKTSSDAPEFDAYFELAKREEKIQAHTNTIQLLRAQIAQLKSPMNAVIDTHKPMSADSHNFQIQNTISLLRHENDCFQAENSKVKQHYKELYDY
jgi:FtsZ-binding cell division protein ZapB